MLWAVSHVSLTYFTTHLPVKAQQSWQIRPFLTAAWTLKIINTLLTQKRPVIRTRDLYTNKTPQTKKGGFKEAWRMRIDLGLSIRRVSMFEYVRLGDWELFFFASFQLSSFFPLFSSLFCWAGSIRSQSDWARSKRERKRKKKEICRSQISEVTRVALANFEVSCWAGSIRKNWKKEFFWKNPYGLWLTASGARRLRGFSSSSPALPVTNHQTFVVRYLLSSSKGCTKADGLRDLIGLDFAD